MVHIELDGRVAFILHHPAARSVDVVGAFHGWDERRHSMTSDGDGRWTLELDLPAGEHLFRYLIDGSSWMIDRRAHGERIAADGSIRSRVWRPPLRLTPDALAA